MKKIHIEGTRFLNEDGKQVLMNGLCFICREKEKGYLESDLDQKFRYYSRHGFNLVRLGIFWDGVEPQPGVYDDVYLGRVKEAVNKAESYGIYVFLDMHQDLYSVKFIDGAPIWATLDEGLPHPKECNIWYEAYVKSPAIMRAADNFWANAPAPDGVGLQEHYERMWEHIAEYFAECTNIIGLEPMNEPYMGSIAPQAFAAAVEQVQKGNPQFDLNNPETARPEDIAVMQQSLNNRFMKFDAEILMPFYSRMLGAIRKHTDAALVTGGNIYCSSFVMTGIEKLEEAQIYAPHGYDAVVDSDQYDRYDKDNVSRVFDGKKESQLRLNLPVVVGEWGNFPSGEYTADLIRYMNEILEKYLWSSTYHQYVDGMEKDSHYDALERGYPTAVAGKLDAYHYDPDSGVLTVEWEAIKGESTSLYLPYLVQEDAIEATGEVQTEICPIQDSNGCYVIIIPWAEDHLKVRIGGTNDVKLASYGRSS